MIAFKRLSEIDDTAIIALMNDPRVRRQMPLTSDTFSEADAPKFVAAKERLWGEHGYGPGGMWLLVSLPDGAAYSPSRAMRTWRWCYTRTFGAWASASMTKSSGGHLATSGLSR